jgi:hypothetical protein
MNWVLDKNTYDELTSIVKFASTNEAKNFR